MISHLVSYPWMISTFNSQRLSSGVYVASHHPSLRLTSYSALRLNHFLFWSSTSGSWFCCSHVGIGTWCLLPQIVLTFSSLSPSSFYSSSLLLMLTSESPARIGFDTRGRLAVELQSYSCSADRNCLGSGGHCLRYRHHYEVSGEFRSNQEIESKRWEHTWLTPVLLTSDHSRSGRSQLQ